MNSSLSEAAKRNSLCAVALLFCALFLALFGILNSGGPVFFISLLLFCGIAVLYLHSSEVSLRPLPLLILAPALALALCFLLFDGPLRFPIFCTALLLFCCAFLYSSGEKASFSSVFAAPLAQFKTAGGALFAPFKKSGRGKIAAIALVALLAAAPLTLFVFSLLYSDAAFGALANSLLQKVSWQPLQYLPRIFIGVLLFFCSCGFLFSLTCAPRKKASCGTLPACQSRPQLPLPAVCAATSPIIALYLFFFLSQSLYFGEVAAKLLPDGFSYSEYARSGFWNLTLIACLNLGLIFLCDLFVKKCKTRTVLTLVLALMTLPFIGLSLLKMGLYIGKFALTPMRVYVALFLCALLLFFVFVIFNRFIPAVKLFPLGVAVLAALMLVIGYGGIDRTVAKYNIELAITRGTELDFHTLDALSDGAVPEFLSIPESITHTDYTTADAPTTRPMREALLRSRERQLRVSAERGCQNLETARAAKLCSK